MRTMSALKETTIIKRFEWHNVFASEMTFDATVNPITFKGREPVLFEAKPDTRNVCPDALKKALELYPDVRLIVVAHNCETPGKNILQRSA